MRTFVKAVIILAVLGALGYFGFTKGQQWLAERNKPRFRVASVEQGDLRITVNAAGAAGTDTVCENRQFRFRADPGTARGPQ